VEEEMDLRAYLEVIIRRWKWIVGCAVAVALVAFIVSLLMPPTYKASALVMITNPRYQIWFEPRFESVENWPPVYKAPRYGAFPELAKSDSVLQEVMRRYELSPQAGIEGWKLREIKEMAGASSEGDPSLVKLTMSARSPEDVAVLANTWADVVVEQGNEIYSGSEEGVAFFEEQMAQAEGSLSKAEAALTAFRARDKGSIVSTQLGSLRQQQMDHLADQRTIGYLIQNIKGLRDQLAAEPADRSTSLGDELTAFALQAKAFNAQDAIPVKLQFDGTDSLSKRTYGEQDIFLDELMRILSVKSAKVEERLAEIEPKILELQEKLQTIKTEEERLVRARELAEDKYTMLARKREEAQIAAQVENSMVRVGSYAAVPAHPVSPRKMLNTIMAGALGLMVGVSGALAVEWWQGYEGNDQ